jgi:adenine-specific DNA-methyltransferase
MPTLRWLTRDDDVRAAERVPYRLLEEVPDLGAGDRDAGNILIQGDNLQALKALLPYYAGAVKCIYIDPPYNTGSAFEHYDDNLEHSQWLAMMWPRLELLRELLAEDGSIWVSIDDREGHYLKVIMDEVFGRGNFVANVVWQKKYAPANDAIWLSDNHDHLMGFAKEKAIWRPNKLARSEKSNAAYKNPDNDRRGPWKAGDYTCAKSADERPNLYYPVTNPFTGEVIWPNTTRVWGYGKEEYERHAKEDRLWWGKSGKNKVPAYKRFLSDVEDDGAVPQTIWLWGDVGHTQDGRKEQIALNSKPFGTPKPERLLERIIEMTSNPGDLVLDSFLGSGTTAAVAQKMGRRYIGIEMGDHAVTHCVPRLKKVIDGEQGGISKSQNWQGGGGFRFYHLGPPVFGEDGQISPDIRFATLAAHIWFAETGTPWTAPPVPQPFLGQHDGRGYALLYNGILGDKSVSGGNVLTRATLARIREGMAGFAGPLTVYGERTALSEASLRTEGITFKQTPYDVRARK